MHVFKSGAVSEVRGGLDRIETLNIEKPLAKSLLHNMGPFSRPPDIFMAEKNNTAADHQGVWLHFWRTVIWPHLYTVNAVFTHTR